MRLEYFQMVDRITAFDRDARAITIEALVPEHSPVFEGHFPGYPLMPGVLLTETMAQASGWLLLALNRFERMPFLTAVKDAKFRNFVTPKQVLSVTATLEHDGSGYAVTKAKIEADGKAACDATLTFRIMPFPHPDLERAMRDTAQRIAFPAEAMAHG